MSPGKSRGARKSTNLRGLGRPPPVDNFVENLPFNGLKVPRRGVSIGNRSHWQDIKSMQIKDMIAFYGAVRPVWRNAAGPSRHVDTFDDPATALDADGQSVYRLCGQSQILPR